MYFVSWVLLWTQHFSVVGKYQWLLEKIYMKKHLVMYIFACKAFRQGDVLFQLAGKYYCRVSTQERYWMYMSKNCRLSIVWTEMQDSNYSEHVVDI